LTIPSHVAIIMDGNGRWAQQRFLPRIEGHRSSRQAIRRCVEGAVEYRIPYLSLYAFSTENWQRPKNEITALFSIFNNIVQEELHELSSQGVCIHYSGQLNRFPLELQQTLKKAKESTSQNKRLHLNICLDYSGKDEIIRAVKKITQDRIDSETICEELFEKYLDTSEFPPVDLLIRTSGEERISNFMLWQIAYAEIIFLDILWPDFKKETLQQCISTYSQRSRRFGKV
jgi:undecaprenyl diphosphate synthase